MGSAYILHAIVGTVLAVGLLILPVKLHHVSAQSEAALLARNIDDNARSVLATPAGTEVWADITLPSRLGGKRYALAFFSGRVWIGLEDGRMFNYTTIVHSQEIFTGGDTLRLLKLPGQQTVVAVKL